MAALTGMFSVEFIGKDLCLLPAIGTVANKGLKVSELLEARAVSWRGHVHLLQSSSTPSQGYEGIISSISQVQLQDLPEGVSY
jgi:hypothetical protein